MKNEISEEYSLEKQPNGDLFLFLKGHEQPYYNIEDVDYVTLVRVVHRLHNRYLELKEQNEGKL